MTESDIITGFNSYHESDISKQETIHTNAHSFNDDCEVFDLSPEDIDNNVPESVWDSISPNIQNDETNGFTTVQKLTEELVPDMNIALQNHDTHSKQDSLSRLYSKAAKRKHQFSRVLHTHQVIKSGAMSNSHVQQCMV